MLCSVSDDTAATHLQIGTHTKPKSAKHMRKHQGGKHRCPMLAALRARKFFCRKLQPHKSKCCQTHLSHAEKFAQAVPDGHQLPTVELHGPPLATVDALQVAAGVEVHDAMQVVFRGVKHGGGRVEAVRVVVIVRTLFPGLQARDRGTR